MKPPFLARAMAALLLSGVMITGSATATTSHRESPAVRELVHFAAPGCEVGCGSGSTVGPDRALYVTDAAGGRVLRVDPRTGDVEVFADGLPPMIPAVGTGGAMDVVFLGRTAYVLVSAVGPELGQPGVVAGIYRIARDGSATVIADLGAWSAAHPPETDFFVASGVQYALESYRGGLLVSDGHHNRVLWVSRQGQIRELEAFGNVVPTGLETHGDRIYVAQAGPIPHHPEDGKVVRLSHQSAVREVASGAPLIVDVELGRRQQLYALSQGVWDLPQTPENEGKPASPDTGKVLRADGRGGLLTVVGGLDRPTSFELIGDRAFVVTLTGKVIKVDLAKR
ncbi:ScyD/ScyE family protein [Microlunatus sp. GCM10028923]|uniref:ScyD/ScyE family protein n=1 Tax=Microlunatus sp. GCM10028923 TaxID=3273400 RepID=UPI003608ACAE